MITHPVLSRLAMSGVKLGLDRIEAGGEVLTHCVAERVHRRVGERDQRHGSSFLEWGFVHVVSLATRRML